MLNVVAKFWYIISGTIKQDMKKLNFLTKLWHLIQTNDSKIPIIDIPQYEFVSKWWRRIVLQLVDIEWNHTP